MIGCGTIMDIEDAQNALDAGAEFIVMPVSVPEVSYLTRAAVEIVLLAALAAASTMVYLPVYHPVVSNIHTRVYVGVRGTECVGVSGADALERRNAALEAAAHKARMAASRVGRDASSLSDASPSDASNY
jgi:hypothetical protein